MNTSKYKDIYRIESARLKGYDYSENGAYFITICTKNRESFFGNIFNNEMQLSQIGHIVKDGLIKMSGYYRFAILDEFIVMPNHVHAIVIITNGRDAINHVSTGAGGVTGKNNPMVYQSVSRIIRWYKGRTAFEIYKIQENRCFAWQSRFYDHIIRNEKTLDAIRQYIIDNPKNWEKDELFL